MKSLIEIVEELKVNGNPDYEELRYAVLVYSSLLSMEHRHYREVLLSEKEIPVFIKKMKAENSFNTYKTALNKPPKEYLGWENDPKNPEYQKFHALENKLLDKVISKIDSGN